MLQQLAINSNTYHGFSVEDAVKGASFVNCIENNQDNNLIPLKDVLYNLKVLKAIENSLEIGLEVRVK